MQLLVDTSRITFTVTRDAVEKQDQNGRQKSDRNTSEPLWVVNGWRSASSRSRRCPRRRPPEPAGRRPQAKHIGVNGPLARTPHGGSDHHADPMPIPRHPSSEQSEDAAA